MEMRFRRHHNNSGLRSIKNGTVARQVEQMARRLGIGSDTHYQNCVVTLSDGNDYVFTGKAVVFEGETRTVKDIQFTIPKPLPSDCHFSTLGEDG